MSDPEKSPSANPEEEGRPEANQSRSEDNRQRFRRLLSEGKAWEEGLDQDPDSPNPDSELPKSPGVTARGHLETRQSARPPAETRHPEDPNSETLPPLPDPEPGEARPLQASQLVGNSDATPDDATAPPENLARGRTPPPPPPLGVTPKQARPSVDSEGMPLPRRVGEVDVGATRVAPSAYRSEPISRPVSLPLTGPRPAYNPAARPATTPHPDTQPVRGSRLRRSGGCLMRFVIVLVFVLVVLGLVAASFMLFQYYQIAATLPPVDDLRARAAQFETTHILDRNGDLLYEIIDPTAGRRTYVRMEEMSPFIIAATLSTEDKNYYTHPGFDPWAILRAFIQNFQSGDTVSGASTITQQLARNLLFDPDERGQRTYLRKVREALLAEEITRRYSKEETLELYLNEVYYGNLAYGVEAASQTYFGIPANQITIGQAAFLAGLIQAPSVYDVYTNPERTMERQRSVMVLMFELSAEQDCIYVSTSVQQVCVSNTDVVTAIDEIEKTAFASPEFEIRYPHWVNYVRLQLEQQFDAQTIYRSGFTIHTTLDPVMQEEAQRIVAEQVALLEEKNGHNGALIAIDPATGEILAMVGSADFYNADIDGQVNMATAPRQPGSSIKPLTFLAAFEQGWTPSTLIWDVPSEFTPSGEPDDQRPPYKPVNYDERFHGPVTIRTALANSYNIPAVKALEFVGIYDEGGLIATAERLGITTLTRPDYGMSLTLGGGEVPLLEMTGAYAVLANGGRRVPSVSITRIVDSTGTLVFEYEASNGEQVVRPEHAFLLSNIMSDNAARTPSFGPNSVLNLPFQAASKTGTTNDFRDNWTVGYTPDVVVGVWVGNADNSAMHDTSGLSGAAPIWAEYITFAVQHRTGGTPRVFTPPAGISEQIICAVSGTLPSDRCPSQRAEFFAANQPPLPASEDLWKRVEIDTWTGLEAAAYCNDFTRDRLVINTTDRWAVDWISDTGQGASWAEGAGFERPFAFAPERKCRDGDPRATIEISAPRDGSKLENQPIDIKAALYADNGIEEYLVEYRSIDKGGWKLIENGGDQYRDHAVVAEWEFDPDKVNGPVEIRITLIGSDDAIARKTIEVDIQVATPTPTPTETSTPTSTPTETPTPTNTPTVTPTPTASETPGEPTATADVPPSPTPSPSLTPFLPPTVTPSPTP